MERIKGPLRLSGYSACGQDGGVQLPRQYVDGECLSFRSDSFQLKFITCNQLAKSAIPD